AARGAAAGRSPDTRCAAAPCVVAPPCCVTAPLAGGHHGAGPGGRAGSVGTDDSAGPCDDAQRSHPIARRVTSAPGLLDGGSLASRASAHWLSPLGGVARAYALRLSSRPLHRRGAARNDRPP